MYVAMHGAIHVAMHVVMHVATLAQRIQNAWWRCLCGACVEGTRTSLYELHATIAEPKHMSFIYLFIYLRAKTVLCVLRPERAIGHNYIGHKYTGHDYIGHKYTGHNYIGRAYRGHNYISPTYIGHNYRP